MKEYIPETKMQKITQVSKVLRPHVFRELDLRKEKIQHDPDYDDSKWSFEAFESLDDCAFHYSDKSTLFGGIYWYYPFRLENYELGSPEYEVIEKIRYGEAADTITKAAMARLLNEWKQKEESACRKKRIQKRIQRIKTRLDESKAVAAACDVPVDTVLMIELRDTLNTVSDELHDFLSEFDWFAGRCPR